MYYTAGINQGIKRALVAGAKYVLLCADDVVLFEPTTIRKLYDYLEKDHGSALASTVHLSGDKRRVLFAGGEKCFPWGCHICPPLEHDILKSPYQIAWANTSCCLVRAEAIQECGLLDEKMRFICSDADYSFTLRSRGWSCDLVPSAQVIHEYGMASQRTGMDELNKVKHEDCLYFMNKWITGGLFQELSVEGRGLTHADIESRYNEIMKTLEHYSSQTGRVGGANITGNSINLG